MRGDPVGASHPSTDGPRDVSSPGHGQESATPDAHAIEARRQRRLRAAVASCLEQLEGRLLFTFDQPINAALVPPAATAGAPAMPHPGQSPDPAGLTDRTATTRTASLVSAAAVANTWVGAAGGNWETASNWSAGHAPTASEDAVITLNGTYTININQPATVASLTLGGATGTQTLVNRSSGTGLTVNGPSAVRANGVLTNNTAISDGLPRVQEGMAEAVNG